MFSLERDDYVKLHIGDCVEVMKTLPDSSIDCCITSPPYFNLRQYLPDDMVEIREDLTDEEIIFVMEELKKINLQI